jgi:hypothetical protein
MRSVPPRGSGWVLGRELRLVEHERNGPTRYRVVVLTSWARSLCEGQAVKLHSTALAPRLKVRPDVINTWL